MIRAFASEALRREEDAYRVEADEWWQVLDGGNDVLQGYLAGSAELAGGSEGSSPPRKGSRLRRYA